MLIGKLWDSSASNPIDSGVTHGFDFIVESMPREHIDFTKGFQDALFIWDSRKKSLSLNAEPALE